MKDPAVNPGDDPAEVLTDEEMEALMHESDEIRLDAWLFTEPELEWLALTDKERNQQLAIARLQSQLDLFVEHPELVPYISTAMSGPAYLEFDETLIYTRSNLTEREAERNRLRIKAQARALRSAGFTIAKELSDEGDLAITATRDDLDFRIMGYAGGYCQYVETDLTERVEVVDVPEEVAQLYTRVEAKPVTRRVCAPLMTDHEVEAV